MKKRSFNILVQFLAIGLTGLLLSCQFMAPRNVKPPANVRYENRVFTLDFEKDTYRMSDVEALFFTTFPHDDPTQGDVVYDRRHWINERMIRLNKGDGLYLYVKYRGDDKGYDSVRMTSKSYYNLNAHTQKLLFVFKGKLPSARGVWPAWWLNGGRQDQWTYRDLGKIDTDDGLDRYSGEGHYYDTPSGVNPTDWPGAGEIDIIETINGDDVIHNTLHTCPQMCDSKWNADDGIINCGNAIPGLDPNSGCSGNAYESINSEGTFACLWGRNTIQFYYWKPDEEVRGRGGPLSDNPDPKRWRIRNLMNEVQLLETQTGCDSDSYGEWQCQSCRDSNTCLFTNMKLIFNITLCGKWAGEEFDGSVHALLNCQKYVVGEGEPFINNQFLKIEYISVTKL